MKTYQNVRARIDIEEARKYKTLNFKNMSLRNLIQLILKTCQDESIDPAILKESFEKYSQDYIKNSEELTNLAREIAFKYAGNVPCNRETNNLNYIIYPEEQEIVYTYAAQI